MNLKSGLTWMLAGVGAAVLYQQTKNGNLNKMINDVANKKKQVTNKLENMM